MPDAPPGGSGLFHDPAQFRGEALGGVGLGQDAGEAVFEGGVAGVLFEVAAADDDLGVSVDLFDGEGGFESGDPAGKGEIHHHDFVAASFFVGFAWADVAECGASVLVVPDGPEFAEVAQQQADKIRDYVVARFPEFEFRTPTLKVAETVDAFAHIEHAPLVVSDSGDNTTGGGVGYSTVIGCRTSGGYGTCVD